MLVWIDTPAEAFPEQFSMKDEGNLAFPEQLSEMVQIVGLAS